MNKKLGSAMAFSGITRSRAAGKTIYEGRSFFYLFDAATMDKKCANNKFPIDWSPESLDLGD